ncbi:hypothetical protein MWH28_09065 [Natroniella sulfidigena]|uniref:hypothetical protein n=1 Tax=Natroniella sulfidigena TaxID=723921 RepID=UPI002009FB1B|nr:hypothetical protein [Natroniella sulfidigena]MCK8817504.1 hypothetical protein [Natroniella sulfidigena]
MGSENSFLKEILNSNLSRSQLKFIRYLVLFILVGVFLMLLGDFGSDLSESKVSNQDYEQQQSSSEGGLTLERELEEKLASILSQVQGVGKVAVDVTLDTGSEYIYARDYQQSSQEVKEEDDAGGVRNTVESDDTEEIVVLNKGSGEEALVEKEIRPKIRGVLVVAEGAQNSYIKADLMQAIRRGLGVASHKIVVLPKGR